MRTLRDHRHMFRWFGGVEHNLQGAVDEEFRNRSELSPMCHSVTAIRHPTGTCTTPGRSKGVMSKATSVAILAAAMVVNFLLWWAILTSAAWVADATTSVVVAAVR